MREWKIPQAIAMILLASALTAAEAQSDTAKAEVTNLLREFLSKVDSSAMHERFWADDLIYTGSSGVVRTKQEIVKSVRESEGKPADPKEPKVTFDAEDISVRQFGDLAVLNFKLVQHTAGQPDNFYRNSGTLVKRDGKWQVVSWQATKADGEKK
jgi:hypothetical protein